MDATSMAQPALVTGATGFIGRALIARLLREQVRVRALVLPEEVTQGVLPAEVEVVRGDIADAAAVSAAVRGAGSVFHLAAVVGDWGAEELFRRVTVGGTRNVMNAAADKGTRVFLASSVVVYADAIPTAICDEDLPWGRALGPYSRAKQQQESLAWEIAKAGNVPLTVVRPTNVYGPGSRPWVHDVVDQLRRGTPALVGGGDFNAGLVHVDNVVEVFVRAAAAPASVGRAYNAGDGSEISWRRYFTDVAAIVGARPPTSVPRPVAVVAAFACEAAWRTFGWGGRPPLTREALNLIGSAHRVPIERARRELGYVPRVDYAEGIRSVAEYLRQRGQA